MKASNFFKSTMAVFTMPTLLFFSSCNSNKSMNNSTSTDNTSAITSAAEVKPAELKPTEPKPAWGKDMTDPMAVVTEKLSSYKAPALTGLTAQEARK